MKHVQEADLAWSLIDVAKPKLDGRERNHVFVSVGAGDSFTAIRILIKLIADKQIPLPTWLVQLCARWLDAYVLHEDHQRLHVLIGALGVIDPAIVRSFGCTKYPSDQAISADLHRSCGLAARAG